MSVLHAFTERRNAEESLQGDAREVLRLLTPGRVVNIITMECALDPRLHREPHPIAPDEEEHYKGAREDRRRWEERQPIAHQRARAALATLMMLGLVEEDTTGGALSPSVTPPEPNFYFKRTTWR